MTTFLIVAALVGWATVLRRRCRWEPEAIPLALFASVIVALFLFGLVGSLRTAAWVLIGGGLLGGMFEWWAAGWPLRLGGWRPGFVIFVAVSFSAVWRLQGAAFSVFDEFSHWGLVAKVITGTGQLMPPDSPVLLRDYPPGSALFYFFLTFGRAYSEALLYGAHAVLLSAAAAAVCIGSGWFATVVAFITVYFGLYAFSGGLQMLSADALVSLFFGAALGGYFRDDVGNRSWVVPVLLALPLLKSVGLMLALFAAVVIACDQLNAVAPWRRRAAYVLVLIIAPLAISGAWRLQMRATSAPPTFRVPVIDTAALSVIRKTRRDQLTTERFQRALTSSPVNPPWADTEGERVAQRRSGRPTPAVSVAACTCLFALAAALAAVLQQEWSRQRRVLLAAAVLLACVVVYGAGLLVMYVNSFTYYEGTRLASFGRYFGIPFLGLSLVVLAWLLTAWRASRWRRVVAVSVTCLLTVGVAFIATPEARRFPAHGPRGLSAQRRQVQDVLRTALLTPQARRVYLVWQGTQGLEFHQSRYELAPRDTNKSCWSVGQPGPDDLWTCPVSQADWAVELQRYDHLVLGRVDDRFWRSFGTLFEGGLNARTFAVEKIAAPNGVRLTAVIGTAEK